MADPVCLDSDLVTAKDASSPAAEVSDIEKPTMIFVFIFCLIGCLVNVFTFFWYKHEYQRLRVRVGCFTFLYFVAVLLFTFGMVFPLVIGITRVPCWFVYAAPTMAVGFFIGTSFTRSSTFMLMTRLATCTYDYGRIPVDETAQEEERQKNMGFFMRTKEEMRMILYALSLFFRTSAINQDMSRKEQVWTLVTLRFLTGIKGSVLFSLICILPIAINVVSVIGAIPAFAHGCTGCPTNNMVLVINVACLGTFGTINAVVFVIKCRMFPDTWGVFREGRLSARGIVLALVGFFLMAFLSVDNRFMFTLVMGVGFTWSLTTVMGYQVYVAYKTETRTFKTNSHPQSMNPPKSKKSSLVGGGSESTLASNGSNLGALTNPVSDLKCSKLAEVLANPTMARAFEYHLSTEFGGENLYFLQDVYEWLIAYSDISKSACIARAKKLINTYISSEGLYQINISSQMAAPLLRLLQAKDMDAIPRNIFDAARSEIAILLENGPVPRFMATKEYSNLISGDVVVQNFA